MRGRAAGQAVPGRWEIRLNRDLLRTHPEHLVKQTVPHEVAHLVDFALHPENFVRRRGARRSPHGPHWQAIMRLFGVPAERCHSLPTLAARKQLKPRVRMRYVYRCVPCDRLALIGPKHHRLLQRRGAQLKSCEHVIGRTADTAAALARRAQRRRHA